MNKPFMSFMLVLLIEGICAIVNYLESRLMQHFRQRGNEHGFGHDADYA